MHVFLALEGSLAGIYQERETDQGWSFTSYEPGAEGEDAGLVAAPDTHGRMLAAWVGSAGQLMFSAGNAAISRLHPPKTAPGFWSGVRTLAVASNQDGRLELFGLMRSEGNVRSLPQANTTAWNWGAPRDLGGHDLRSISVTPYRDGRLALVALGGDRKAYWISQTGPNNDWGPWSSLGALELQAVAAQANADGRLEAVALGGDGNLWHRYETAPGVWRQEWRLLASGPFTEPLSLVANQNGSLEAFARSAQSGSPFHTWQLVPNGEWRDGVAPLVFVGAHVFTSQVVSRYVDGRLALFVARPSGELAWTRQVRPNGDGGWEPWKFVGPPFKVTLAESDGWREVPPAQIVPPPPPSTGAISGSYIFPGDGARRTITVTFKGTLVAAATQGFGSTSFEVPVTVTLRGYRDPPAKFRTDRLKAGTWRVQANTGGGERGAIECSVTVEIGRETGVSFNPANAAMPCQ